MIDRILAIRESADRTTIRLRTCDPVRSVGELTLGDRIPDVEIRSVQLVRPTLEDAFVALTGSSISDEPVP